MDDSSRNSFRRVPACKLLPRGRVLVSARVECLAAPVALWRAEQAAASSAMQIEDCSDADACWDRATLEQHLVRACSRGICFGQGPHQDRLHAEVLRLTAASDALQRTAAQQAASLRQ